MPRNLRTFKAGVSAMVIMACVASCTVSGAKRPFWGAALDGYPLTPEILSGAAEEMQTPLQLAVFFMHWPSAGSGGDFPGSSLDAVWGSGALPCITWEPFILRDGREEMIPHAEFTGGGHDRYISKFAAEAAAWGKPLIIRFAHEMNIERYHWGTTKAQYGPQSPEIYRGMYRHVVNIFKKSGAGNVLWAFCPNAESVPDAGYDPSAGWNRAAAYYPGDDLVDILGIDGYNWGTTQTLAENGWQSRWRSFESIFQAGFTELRSISAHKPIVVFETASATQGGDKSKWVREMLDTARRWSLAGVVWFQVHKEIDWRFRTGLDEKIAVTHPNGDAARQWALRCIEQRRKGP